MSAANWQRRERQERLATERWEAKQTREFEQAQRAARRQAAADEQERKRLYIEDPKAEAAAMAADVQDRIAELDSVLIAGLHQGSGVSFASLTKEDRRKLTDPGYAVM